MQGRIFLITGFPPPLPREPVTTTAANRQGLGRCYGQQLNALTAGPRSPVR